MKTVIKIIDSNGLRKAEDFLNRIKHTPFYAKIPARVKAWLKVTNAMDYYDDVLITNQADETVHLFNYNQPIEEKTYGQKLTDGFTMMGNDD